MADSDAVRSRRKRAHAAGDHSLCTSRCQARRAAPLEHVHVPQIGRASADFDPAAEMRNLAVRLAAAYAADPGNAGLARELRATLLAIEPEEPGWDPIRELQLDEWRSRQRERDE